MERSRVKKNAWEYGRLHRRSALFSFACALLLTAFVFSALLQGTQVADAGMAPTLQAGDVLLFSRWSKYLKSPKRGDIFAFAAEEAQGLGRIVGLPGERVALQGGNVYIDGVFLSEGIYIQHAAADMEEITLGENEYFLLPDSRAYMQLDADRMRVGIEALKGRAFMRVAPLRHAGFFA